ncbi:ABC transporter permease [Salsipaludibacter albus]|uniref:ABC transporter permease n=1 Tax=Salsipaludibacter albus TaxID=2849650 RepID=UPI001EE3BBFB|nr:ABC transporter permease [Salsipaludibacter albus]MBY5163864.1 ABC transporter permease [Salsipaludibacter albus]
MSTSTGPIAQVRERFDLSTTAIIWLAFLLTLVVGVVLVGSGGGNLLSQGNIVNLLSRTSVLGFIAIGQTLVILCRSLDLSVGYTAALASIVGATLMDGDPGRIVLGVVAALAVSAVVGLVNGLVITGLRVNPFIATLGMGLIIKGYLDTRYAGPVGDVPVAFQGFGYTRIGPVPLATIVMLAVAAAAVVLLNRTRSGHAMYAVGGNVEAARLSGIRTGRTMVLAHVLCSTAAGLAGLLLASRFSTGVGAQIYGAGYDLDSIAAVVLGGTLLMGGRGGVGGTVAGVLILATLDTVFNLLQVDPFFRDVLRGVIIIAAVALYARRQLDLTAHRQRFTASGRPIGASEGEHLSGPSDPPESSPPSGPSSNPEVLA